MPNFTKFILGWFRKSPEPERGGTGELSQAMQNYYNRKFLERATEILGMTPEFCRPSFGYILQKNLRFEIGWPAVKFPVIKFFRYNPKDVL